MQTRTCPVCGLDTHEHVPMHAPIRVRWSAAFQQRTKTSSINHRWQLGKDRLHALSAGARPLPPPALPESDVAFGVIMINTADPAGRGRTSPAHISNILSSSERETPPEGVIAVVLSVGRSQLPTLPPFFLANWLLSSCFTY